MRPIARCSPSPALTAAAAKALRRHERHVRGRYELRRFLDAKSDGRACGGQGSMRWRDPLPCRRSSAGLAADKLDAVTGAAGRGRREARAPPRYLLSDQSSAPEAKHDEHTRGRRRRLYRLPHLPRSVEQGLYACRLRQSEQRPFRIREMGRAGGRRHPRPRAA